MNGLPHVNVGYKVVGGRGDAMVRCKNFKNRFYEVTEAGG